jgi:LAO/AO transport system kinase
MGVIGDIFVINKSDREGVYATEKELESLLSLSTRADGWDPPIVRTVATEAVGIQELAQAIERFSDKQGDVQLISDRRHAIARWRIMELLQERLLASVLKSDAATDQLERLADEVATRRRDPYSAVDELLGKSEL